jgi:hypothetical protein
VPRQTLCYASALASQRFALRAANTHPSHNRRCGPCRMIAPLIDELAAEYGGKIKAVRVA